MPCRAPCPAERLYGSGEGLKVSTKGMRSLVSRVNRGSRARIGLVARRIFERNGGSRGRECRRLGVVRGCEAAGSDRVSAVVSIAADRFARRWPSSARPARAAFPSLRIGPDDRLRRWWFRTGGSIRRASSERTATISSETRARPKSVILSVPSSVTSKLPGLISR